LFDLNAERTQCVNRVHAIIARQETAQDTHTIGKRSDNRSTMRNALIARERNLGVDARRSFYAKFHQIIFVGNLVRSRAFKTSGNARRPASNIARRCPANAAAVCENVMIAGGERFRDYGTRKILFVYGSFTSVPGGKPRTST